MLLLNVYKKKWCNGNGQHGGASAWVFGGTVCLEIPMVQVTGALLEDYYSSHVSGKAFPPGLAGLAPRLNYYEVKTTCFTCFGLQWWFFFLFPNLIFL